jgi:hypothetical protein
VESSDEGVVLASYSSRETTTTNDSDSDDSNLSVAEGDFFCESSDNADKNAEVIWTVWQVQTILSDTWVSAKVSRTNHPHRSIGKIKSFEFDFVAEQIKKQCREV